MRLSLVPTDEGGSRRGRRRLSAPGGWRPERRGPGLRGVLGAACATRSDCEEEASAGCGGSHGEEGKDGAEGVDGRGTGRPEGPDGGAGGRLLRTSRPPQKSTSSPRAAGEMPSAPSVRARCSLVRSIVAPLKSAVRASVCDMSVYERSAPGNFAPSHWALLNTDSRSLALEKSAPLALPR